LRSCRRCCTWVAGPSHRYRQAVASEAGSWRQVWRPIVIPACRPCSASMPLHNSASPLLRIYVALAHSWSQHIFS
jgi:hypothetical protein